MEIAHIVMDDLCFCLLEQSYIADGLDTGGHYAFPWSFQVTYIGITT